MLLTAFSQLEAEESRVIDFSTSNSQQNRFEHHLEARHVETDLRALLHNGFPSHRLWLKYSGPRSCEMEKDMEA